MVTNSMVEEGYDREEELRSHSRAKKRVGVCGTGTRSFRSMVEVRVEEPRSHSGAMIKVFEHHS